MSNINKTYIFETVLISGGTSGTTLEFFTGATFDTGTGNLDFITNSGTTINVPLDGRYSLTGHSHSEYTLNTAFTAHTTDTSIHFTKNSISLSDLGSTAHTHTISDVTDFPTNISYFTNDAGYLTGATSTDNDYVTGATFNLNDGVLEFTRLSGDTFNVNLDNRYAFSSGHTHDISEITGFTDNSTDWDNAFLESITGMTVTGTVSKTITLEQRNGNIITADFVDNSGGSGSGDVVTGMTFNTGTGVLELRTLSGSTIQENLDGRYLLTGFTQTDDYVSGGTFNINTGLLEFVRVSGGTFNIELDGRYSLTGHTHSEYALDSTFNSHTGDTVIHVSQTDRDRWDAGGTNAAFESHTGDTSIHFTKDEISLSDLGITAHTHTVSEITDFPTNVSYFTNDVGYLTGATSTDNDYVTGATFNTTDGVLEFTRLSGDTFNVNLDNRYSLTGHTHNLSELNNDIGFVTGATSTADDYLSGGTFDTGTGDLDLVRLSGETVTINLDGRYFLAGPITFSAETSGTTTYVGYGTVNACKIRKIETVSGSTYTAYWSEGVETLDKIWANRYTYSYF